MPKTISISNPEKVIESKELVEATVEAAQVAPVIAVEEADLYNQPGVDAKLDAISKDTAEALAKFPRHKIIIPLDQFNKSNLLVPHCNNGFVRYFRRGVPIVVDDPTIGDLQTAGYNPTITL